MSTFNYTATDDLYSFEKMHKYNKFIANHFIKSFQKTGFVNGKILDFGAGIGTISAVIREEKGVSPIALEIDEAQAEIISKRGFEVFTSLEKVDSPIDACFSSNVLEHIEDDVAALISIKEKMKTGGVVAIFVPAFQTLWTEMDDQVGHYRRYTKKSLSKALEKAGFAVVDSQYCDSLGFIAVYILKLFAKRRKAETSSFMKIYDRFLLPMSLLIDKLGAKYFFGKNVFAFAIKKD